MHPEASLQDMVEVAASPAEPRRTDVVLSSNALDRPLPGPPSSELVQLEHVSIVMLHPNVTTDIRAIVNTCNEQSQATRRGSVAANTTFVTAKPEARNSVIHLQRQLQGHCDTSSRVRTSRAHFDMTTLRTGDNPIDDPFAIANLPPDIQRGFRMKVFGLLAVQLLYVSMTTSILTFAPTVQRGLWTWLQEDYAAVVLLAAFVAGLVVLHAVKYSYPVNYIVFAIFSTCQAVLVTAIGIQFDTYAGCVACYASLLVVLLLMEFSTAKSGALFMGRARELVPIRVAGAGAFVVAAVPLAVAYGIFQDMLMTPLEFVLVLAFVVLMTTWFACDVSYICKRLSPDEYMQGTVFFYTDMLVFLMVVFTLVAMATTGTALPGMCSSCRCLFDPIGGNSPDDTRDGAHDDAVPHVVPMAAIPPTEQR
ncbi:hypothetical protein H310_04276 [Aphanomyces invadans]|nr:hypothetical protein H310_04276 [Aphanomyces invadans]ETW05325.1 hypothetical protein H310_04276 [Aphanomyces invadans]|eukprot:XP_008866763.1 hypothetical protein H310_04276 [Aphanomyces invadans]